MRYQAITKKLNKGHNNTPFLLPLQLGFFNKMVHLRFLLTAFLLITTASFTFLSAQSRAELEERRKLLIKEIERTTKQLEETKKDKAAALDRYVALQNQISAREKLIKTLQQEIEYVENRLIRTNQVITALEADLERLRNQYAELLRTAHRQKKNRSNLLYLFSAKNFNQAFMRWQYLRQFEAYREKQAKLILKTQTTLQQKTDELKLQKEDKQLLLLETEKQRTTLQKAFLNKDRILASLKTSEATLVKELQEQRKSHERLNVAIENVITTEIERNRRAARRPEETSSLPARLSPEVLTNTFAQKKGNLPWPVDNGEISKKFGTQEHPTIPNLTITNNGVDFLSSKDAPIVAVFSGIIVGKQFIPGYDYTLILQHGNYYTVYSNLQETYVERGDEIRQGKILGIAKASKTHSFQSEVHFEVWHNKIRQNPELWLQKYN